MKTRCFAVIGAVMTLAIIGCGQKEGSAPDAPTATSGTPAASQTTPAATAGAALASEQTAGPFTVTLTADPAQPTEGEATFTAVVTRGGKPVPDAHVHLSLSMPTMNMGGPEVDMAHAEGGRYTGKANLSMGGAWAAKVEVHQGDQTGTATYDFTAMQK